MHRSGTSVTTNLLNAFGVPLSDDLMEATQDNAKGYFESREISRVQDAILDSMGMLWRTSSLVVPFPRNWWHAPVVQQHKRELAQIVRREMDRHGGLWGFKDPRTARLLPVWIEIFQEFGIDAKYVLVTRHPVDVAKSLFAREQIDPMHAEIMWLEHNADALLHLNGNIHALVDYRGWIETPVEQAQYMIRELGIDASYSQDELQSIVKSVVSSDLRHHLTAQNTYQLPFTHPMYEALLRRDKTNAKSLAEVFNISRGFTQVILAQAKRSAEAQTQQLHAMLQASHGKVAELEAKLAAASFRSGTAVANDA